MLKPRIILKSIFRIELVFVYVALINLFYTVYLKNQAARKYNELDSKMNYMLTDYANPISDNSTLLFFTQLQNEYEPYIYFENELQTELDKINNAIIQKMDFSTLSLFSREFQGKMFATRKRLNFGYDSMIATSLILLLTSAFVILYKKLVRENDENSKKILADEQTKIRQDLHDGLAQDLATLKIFLEKKDYDKTQFYANQALSEVRYILNSMNSDFEQNTDSVDFENLLKQNIQVFELHFGIKTQFLSSFDLSILPAQIKIHLWRILQETLSNIARHANATEVSIKFVPVVNDLKFIISDNGKGLDNQSDKDSNVNQHHGLKNIQQRAQKMNASVEFINNGGTTIAITIKDIIR